MSALGQKQTFASQNDKSALPPIATARADPRKRGMSAFPPKSDMRGALAYVRFGPIADLAYSITSSARESNCGGTVRPSALAVLRLITSSNLVGACTGKSPGFSPLRIRST